LFLAYGSNAGLLCRLNCFSSTPLLATLVEELERRTTRRATSTPSTKKTMQPITMPAIAPLESPESDEEVDEEDSTRAPDTSTVDNEKLKALWAISALANALLDVAAFKAFATVWA